MTSAEVVTTLPPLYVLADILNRLEVDRTIAKAQLVCKDFREAGDHVRSYRIVVLDKYHESARLGKGNTDTSGLRFGIPANSKVNDGEESMPSKDESAPSEDKSALSEDKSALSEDKSAPSEDKSAPSEDKSAPSEDKPAPSEDKPAPTQDKPAPTQDKSAPSQDVSAPFQDISASSQGKAASSQDMEHAKPLFKFKEQMIKNLEKKHDIVQLRIEVEAKLQAKTVPDDERRRTDFWISEPHFLWKWLPGLKFTLQHLCIVDYGQQAIMRRSSIIRILSQNCKILKTLDLRNMFLDTHDCEQMPSLVSLTWRCVKVTGGALQDLNHIMPKLQTLALLGVFGVEGGQLTFDDMKVLCLGLSTPAKEVKMHLPKLEKLQLKMECPESLIIWAPILKYVAFNLEVAEDSKVELRSIGGVVELLYGASSYVTLSSFVERNPQLKKIFLDIPCMALGEDGRFLGVLNDVPLNLPSYSKLHDCRNLQVLNIGPGLWYCMESNVETLLPVEKWPSMEFLILHMIPHNLQSSITILRLLLRPSVAKLVIYIHTTSVVNYDELAPEIEEVVRSCEQHINLNILTWTKSLDFSCFSF